MDVFYKSVFDQSVLRPFIEKMYRPHDNLSVLATLKADGTVEKTVVGSIVETCILDSENEAEYGRLKEIFTKDSLQFL